MSAPFTPLDIAAMSDDEAGLRLAVAAGFTTCYGDAVEYPTSSAIPLEWWDNSLPASLRWQLYILDHRGSTGYFRVLCSNATMAAAAVTAAYGLAGSEAAISSGTAREIVNAALYELSQIVGAE